MTISTIFKQLSLKIFIQQIIGDIFMIFFIRSKR